jgi:hypothetical protein
MKSSNDQDVDPTLSDYRWLLTIERPTSEPDWYLLPECHQTLEEGPMPLR